MRLDPPGNHALCNISPKQKKPDCVHPKRIKCNFTLHRGETGLDHELGLAGWLLVERDVEGKNRKHATGTR